MPFVQVVEHKQYILVAVLQTRLDGVDILIGADVYSRQGEPKGFWPVSNMPNGLGDKLRAYTRLMRGHDLRSSRTIRTEDDL